MSRPRLSGIPEPVTVAARVAAAARAALDSAVAGGTVSAELAELIAKQTEAERQFACALLGSLQASLAAEERQRLLMLLGAAAILYPELVPLGASLLGESVEAIELQRDVTASSAEKFAASEGPSLRVVN